jgi:hypothetical protein
VKLNDIINFQVGDKFLYKGKSAIVVWREYTDDLVGINKDGIELRVKHFGLNFDSAFGNVTLRSMHPNPLIVDLEDYGLK